MYDEKMMESDSSNNMHIYKGSCNSVQRFKRICAYKVVTTIYNIWPNSKFKRDNIPIKIMESEFPSYYTSRQCALHTHKNLYYGSNDPLITD